MSQLPLERTENAAICRRPKRFWLHFPGFYSVPLKLLRPLRAALSNLCNRTKGAANLNHPQSEFVTITNKHLNFLVFYLNGTSHLCISLSSLGVR